MGRRALTDPEPLTAGAEGAEDGLGLEGAARDKPYRESSGDPEGSQLGVRDPQTE